MPAPGSNSGSASHRRDDSSGRRRTTGSQPIAGYHLLQRIGRGSMGIVYRAIQLSMQREVALKVLDPKLAEAPGFTTRFIHEARAAGAVNHPHVITCYDAGTSGELVYQALELLLGGDLDQYCRTHGGRLDEKQAMAIALDCAQGLEGIHAAGLTHRDVKPSNIFIADEGVAKLGDLGLARSLGADETGSTRVASSGDAAFTAPEQLAGGPADIRADLYSLGATLYWMVCGVKPFVPRSDEEREWAAAGAGAADPRSRNPDLSAGVCAVIAKAMAADPGERYANPTHLREDLERVALDFAPIHARAGGVLAIGDGDSGSTRQVRAAQARRTTVMQRVQRADATPVDEPRSLPATWRWLWLASSAGIALGCAAVVYVWGGSGRREQPQAAAPEVGAAPAIVPPAALVIDAVATPPWAVAAGRDLHGRWADLSLAGVAVRFRYCPPGAFRMGEGAETRRVTLSRGFWLGECEVTQAAWAAVANARPSAFVGDDLPVESVSWAACRAFIARARALTPAAPLRLPSEAEWEYACRAGGAGDPGRGWSLAESGRTTHPVGGLPANAWGFRDVLGNVLEWCQDAYAPLPTAAATDPRVDEGAFRVARGGAWCLDETACRATARAKYMPDAELFFIGARLAIDE